MQRPIYPAVLIRRHGIVAQFIGRVPTAEDSCRLHDLSNPEPMPRYSRNGLLPLLLFIPATKVPARCAGSRPPSAGKSVRASTFLREQDRRHRRPLLEPAPPRPHAVPPMI